MRKNKHWQKLNTHSHWIDRKIDRITANKKKISVIQHYDINSFCCCCIFSCVFFLFISSIGCSKFDSLLECISNHWNLIYHVWCSIVSYFFSFYFYIFTECSTIGVLTNWSEIHGSVPIFRLQKTQQKMRNHARTHWNFTMYTNTYYSIKIFEWQCFILHIARNQNIEIILWFLLEEKKNLYANFHHKFNCLCLLLSFVNTISLIISFSFTLSSTLYFTLFFSFILHLYSHIQKKLFITINAKNISILKC